MYLNLREKNYSTNLSINLSLENLKDLKLIKLVDKDIKVIYKRNYTNCYYWFETKAELFLFLDPSKIDHYAVHSFCDLELMTIEIQLYII